MVLATCIRKARAMVSLLIFWVTLTALLGAACRSSLEVWAFDGHSTCARPFRGRADEGGGWGGGWTPGRPPPRPPCDFNKQSWCTVPGSAYPWHAVRRFVQENHGLMRRMYGEQRHLSVLRAELMDSDNFVEGSDFPSSTTPHPPPPLRGRPKKPPLPSSSTPSLSSSQTPEEPEARLSPTAAPSTPVADTDGTVGLDDSTELDEWDDEESTTHAFSTEEAASGVFTGATTDWADVTEPAPTETAVSPDQAAAPIQANVSLSTAAPTTAQTPISAPAAAVPTTALPTQLFQDTQGKNREPAATPQLRLRGVNACPVKEEVVAPFWANNTRGEVLALLNLYPFEQYVHWEKCTYELKQMYCREGCRCEQQYRLHRLLAYDPNNECRGIFSDWFKFPSCCVCRCYDLPAELQLTSRSPRRRTPPSPPPTDPEDQEEDRRSSRPRPRGRRVPPPRWYRGGI